MDSGKKTKEIILDLLENKKHKNILLELFNGKIHFSELKRKSEVSSNTTLSRVLSYFDSVGLVNNIFEKTDGKAYSYYELNHFGKKVAQIVIDLESVIDNKIGEIIPA